MLSGFYKLVYGPVVNSGFLWNEGGAGKVWHLSPWLSIDLCYSD
jgi:hypothetical protein